MAQRIGELNGRWAILLKVTLVAVPAFTTLMLASFLPWAVWVTGNIYQVQGHSGQIILMMDSLQSINTKVSDLPPEEWKARIKITEMEMKQNNIDHTQIKVMLGGIQAKLATIHPSGGGT